MNLIFCFFGFFLFFCISSVKLISFVMKTIVKKHKSRVRCILRIFSMKLLWFFFRIHCAQLYYCVQVRCTVIHTLTITRQGRVHFRWNDSIPPKDLLLYFLFYFTWNHNCTRYTYLNAEDIFSILTLSDEMEFPVKFLLIKFIETQWQIHLRL